jgi:hypothetical protein
MDIKKVKRIGSCEDVLKISRPLKVVISCSAQLPAAVERL